MRHIISVLTTKLSWKWSLTNDSSIFCRMSLYNSCYNFYSVDAFYEPDDFGIVEVVIIGHDNSGSAPGWLLERVSFTPRMHVCGRCIGLWSKFCVLWCDDQNISSWSEMSENISSASPRYTRAESALYTLVQKLSEFICNVESWYLNPIDQFAILRVILWCVSLLVVRISKYFFRASGTCSCQQSSKNLVSKWQLR